MTIVQLEPSRGEMTPMLRGIKGERGERREERGERREEREKRREERGERREE